MKESILLVAQRVIDALNDERITVRIEISSSSSDINLFETINREISKNILFDIILVDAGLTKLRVVKTVKELFNIGLKEAKDLVDKVPFGDGCNREGKEIILATALIQEVSLRCERELKEAGAIVRTAVH